MLDQETKQRIDNLRDTLVGKVPDPKSQVEQIMISMIYKFMNDMDNESTKLGGKRSFFVDDFEKYSWENLFDAKVSGAELVELYSTAVESMEENPNIPTLFRDIFKNAYIPYKDPETLRLFLSQINEFEYSYDSEQLGDAFEHILNTLSSQGDAGQFRTPRHIIDFIVEILDPKKNETILDPASGTSGFLISAYKHIIKTDTEENKDNPLSESERKTIMKNINGYDISPDMVRIGLANMYLHGFDDPNVSEYDALSSEDRWNEYYDVILANPPFMTPKGGIRPHNKFGLKSNRAEVLFVDYILSHLKPKGRAGIIVPEGIIFQTGKAYKELRKKLVENGLIGVVSLPAGVFNPYSGVKTSILILDKSKNLESIFFASLNQDGFSLSAQRNPISKNDLPQVFKEINSKSSGELVKFVSKDEIIENNYSLQFSTYINEDLESSDYEIIQLSEVAKLIRGVNFSKKDQFEEFNDGAIRVATTKAAQAHQIVEKDLYYIPKELIKNKDKYLGDGDILISISNSLHLVGRTTFIKDLRYDMSFGAFMSCLRVDPDVILPEYLYRILNSKKTKKFFIDNARTTTNISNLPNEVILNLQFPLPPLEKQQEIVDEIEQYQKVIDGARQVVENLSISLEPEPHYPVIEISEICNINSESIDPKKIYKEKEFTYVDISSIDNLTRIINLENKLLGRDAPSRAKRVANKNNLIISSVRPNLKAFCKVDFEPTDVVFSTGFMILECITDKVLPDFLLSQLLSNFCMSQFISKMGRGAYPSVNLNDLKTMKIYLPPIEIQEKVVDEILVIENTLKHNRDLINIKENQISRKINSLYS